MGGVDNLAYYILELYTDRVTNFTFYHDSLWLKLVRCSSPVSSLISPRFALSACSQAENGSTKRTVIVTAFGLHDAAKPHLYIDPVQSSSGEQEEVIDLVDRNRATALASCRDVTADLVRAAKGGSSPPPLVFLLRNNDFLPGSANQEFLDNVHRIQLEEIENRRIGSASQRTGNNITHDDFALFGSGRETTYDNNTEGEIFLVDNSVSLYGKLACYRKETSVHYHEPVKLVEAKMLWDLIFLVDRGSVHG